VILPGDPAVPGGRRGPTMSEMTTPLVAIPDLYGPESQGLGYFALWTVGS